MGASTTQVHPAQSLQLWDSIVTIGAFDGVHRGHQALIRRATLRAAHLGVPSVAYTFDPPPKAVFQSAPILTSREEKIERLGALGLDHAVVADFHADYAAREAEEFLEEIAELHPLEIWVGPDFRFGSGAAGGPETLGEHFPTQVFQPVQCLRGEVISSSRVRELMARGAGGEARSLLGWDAGVPEGAWSSLFESLDFEEASLLPGAGQPPRREMQSRDYSYIW